MSERYKVLPLSTSAHCCFKATVVDTQKPEMIGGKQYERDGILYYEAVCECFEVGDAERIATALNALDVKVAP